MLTRLGWSAAAPGREQSTRPRVTVVVPTCGDAASTERTVASILATGYEPIEVVIVENRPPQPATRQLALERFDGQPVRYVEEPRRGASSARNAGLGVASGEIVAFADDDVVVDPAWIDLAVAAFARIDGAACVTGRIRPLALDTVPQKFFDELTVFDKGSQERVFLLPGSRVAEPLFPYAAGHVGSGGNMFIRRDIATALGGFDPLLGPGTPTVGGEDLDLFVRLANSRLPIVYDPAVLVWHDHPRDLAGLRLHALNYGIGLTAMLAKQFARGPGRLRLLQAIPAGIRYGLDPRSRKNSRKSVDYPRSLDVLERLGMFVGPVTYLLSAGIAGWRRLRRG